MIKDKYDLLKILIDNMDVKTHRVANVDNVIENSLDVQTKCDYLTQLKIEGLISIYIGGIVEINDKEI